MPISDTSELTTLLYVSDLAPDTPLSCVGDLVRTARVNNARDGITGLLVFDGARFAQLVQGSAAMVQQLYGRLVEDGRHVTLETLVFGPTAGDLLFPSWQLGYLHVESDAEGLGCLRGLGGMKAIDAFLALVPRLDCDATIDTMAAPFGQTPAEPQRPYHCSPAAAGGGGPTV